MKYYLKWNCFEFSQKVKLHEIFLTKDAGALPSAVDGGGFDDQLQFRNAADVAVAVAVAVHGLHDVDCLEEKNDERLF